MSMVKPDLTLAGHAGRGWRISMSRWVRIGIMSTLKCDLKLTAMPEGFGGIRWRRT